VQAVARSAHEAEASRLQRAIERLTRRAARPAFAPLLTLLVVTPNISDRADEDADALSRRADPNVVCSGNLHAGRVSTQR